MSLVFTAFFTLLGVTLISFYLMVYHGADKTYELAGKYATVSELAELRRELGYDRPFLVRYAEYVVQIATLDFGYSDSTHEKVNDILARTLPISLILTIPGFILGNVLAFCIAMYAAYHRHRWPDSLILTMSSIGMSISYLIITIAFQLFFCSIYGLNLFPIGGWEVYSLSSYLHYVTVPTLVSITIILGYNTRFYRAIILEQLDQNYVRTSLAFGLSTPKVLFTSVLKNCLHPILTRLLYSIPPLVVGGSLILENFFNIPGIGKVSYDAIVSGNQAVLKAIISLSAILFIGVSLLTDVLNRIIDPRIDA